MESEQILGLPYHESALRLCLDDFGQELLRGRVYGMRLEEPIVFGDMTTLLTKVDQMLDRLGIPQAYQKKRQFKNAAPSASVTAIAPEEGCRLSLEQIREQEGKLATATLRITSRQKTTWQGHLIWEGADKSFHFRSDLELMRNIYQHLSDLKR